MVTSEEERDACPGAGGRTFTVLVSRGAVLSMNIFEKKSDSELVEELRRAQRWRRPAGVTFAVLGLLLLALHVWRYDWTRRKVLEIADLSNTQPRPVRDACHSSALLAYTEGFGTGLSTGLFGAFGTLLLFSSVRLRFGGRKDRLLLQHYDRTTPTPQR